MKIGNWKEAERAMGDFASLETKVGQARAAMEISIQAAQDRFFQKTEDLASRQREIEAELRHFARANKKDFKATPNGDGRSRNFNGVRFGFRLTPPFVKIKTPVAALAWLYSSFGVTFLRISKEINRDVLKSELENGNPRVVKWLNDHGITLKQKDKFFIEVEHG